MPRKSIIQLPAFFIMVAALMSCSPAQPVAEATPPPVTYRVVKSKMNDDILYYVNQHRLAKGLSKLQSFDAATVQAYNHSKNMATGRTPFGHTGFEDRINAIAKAEGRMSASAENVAYGELTAREVVQGWLKSPGHKKNIEGNYALTGIGTYTDNRGIVYFTQIFLRR
ncbi:CAP domain-containing protein [Asinibacterium sp. OR53]|uniref:CAP domain-containing protein n=1 Tax=Asinibacterium sp. OR53 TaxID=925409 RepID=UPI000560219A|nr:CAP domain-containing protein [Asinibacterium sp. OR53]